MNETEFAYRIRQALDEGAERVDYTVSLRLEKARRRALDHSHVPETAQSWVPALQLATAAGPELAGRSHLADWLRRLGLVAPVIALAFGIVGIKQLQSDRMVAEVADIDFAVLLDDTPIDIYASQGFGVFLRTEQQSSM